MDYYPIRALRVSPATWNRNLRRGWVYDRDSHVVNDLLHPYQGSLTFNAARTNGYSFWEAAPFPVAGSLLAQQFSNQGLSGRLLSRFPLRQAEIRTEVAIGAFPLGSLQTDRVQERVSP